MKNCIKLSVILGLVLQISGEAYYVKLHKTTDAICTILSEETLRKFNGIPDDENGSVQVTVKDASVLPADSGDVIREDTSKIVEIYGRNKVAVDAQVQTLCKVKNAIERLKFAADAGHKRPRVVRMARLKEEYLQNLFNGQAGVVTETVWRSPSRTYVRFCGNIVIVISNSKVKGLFLLHWIRIALSTHQLYKEMRARSPEIVQIVHSGDKSNRIDVVFMGDGYTATEREKFFDDMTRLTKDMFEGDTFQSYLPVINIWAVYVESVDSGIGYNGAKNTPFKLHRKAGQLRGILTGNATYARQVCKLIGKSGCDYPSIIGNDDYYGGLGGEFVISTRSERTGNIVVRHEMGHNFINVGEEYDDGKAYKGVNTANSLKTIGWKAWLTGPLREERAIYRLLEHPWHDLSNGPQSFDFVSDGSYSSWYLLVSITAAGEEDSLEFLLDGQVLPWKTTGFDDREFYDWSGSEGFTSGQHSFSVRSKTASTNPNIPRMIGSVTLHEFGSASEFNPSPDHISAYPTWDVNRRKTFRPTNAACAMRNMTNSFFCPVCKEGMWLQFFQKISLIDSVQVDSSVEPKIATVNTQKLGQLRNSGTGPEGEALEVKWFLSNVEQVQFRDQFQIPVTPGSWRVQVKFVTPEVRRDPRNFLVDNENFTVT